MTWLITVTLAIGVVPMVGAAPCTEVVVGPLSTHSIIELEAADRELQEGRITGAEYMCRSAALRIVRWTGIPRDQVTAEWIRQHVAWPDLQHIQAAGVLVDERLARFRGEQLRVAEGGDRAGPTDAHVGGGAPPPPAG